MSEKLEGESNSSASIVLGPYVSLDTNLYAPSPAPALMMYAESDWE